jgi:hypothetical protein
VQDLSKSLPIVSSRLIGRSDEGYTRSFPVSGWGSSGHMLPSTWEVLHSKIAFNTLTGRNITLCGRCFRGLFGILFGSGTWPTLRPQMALETPQGWLIQARLWEQRCMLASVRQPSQWLPVLSGLYWLQLDLQTVSQGFSFLRIQQNNSHWCDHGGGGGVWEPENTTPV